MLQLFTGQFDSPENLFWRRAKIVFHFEPAEDGEGFKFFMKYRLLNGARPCFLMNGLYSLKYPQA
jgi:hypothetical protein